MAGGARHAIFSTRISTTSAGAAPSISPPRRRPNGPSVRRPDPALKGTNTILTVHRSRGLPIDGQPRRTKDGAPRDDAFDRAPGSHDARDRARRHHDLGAR